MITLFNSSVYFYSVFICQMKNRQGLACQFMPLVHVKQTAFGHLKKCLRCRGSIKMYGGFCVDLFACMLIGYNARVVFLFHLGVSGIYAKGGPWDRSFTSSNLSKTEK